MRSQLRTQPHALCHSNSCTRALILSKDTKFRWIFTWLTERGDPQGLVTEALFQVSLERRQHKPFCHTVRMASNVELVAARIATRRAAQQHRPPLPQQLQDVGILAYRLEQYHTSRPGRKKEQKLSLLNCSKDSRCTNELRWSANEISVYIARFSVARTAASALYNHVRIDERACNVLDRKILSVTNYSFPMYFRCKYVELTGEKLWLSMFDFSA